MWFELICGLVVYHLLKGFFYKDDAHNDEADLDHSHFNLLFAVAKRLEKLYQGCKVHVGLQIPDPDSASRKNIDLVLVTNQGAVVISVKNVSEFVSIDKDGNWVCNDEKRHKTLCLPNPVAESKQLVSILEEYLEQRGVALPEGSLSFKVICPNPKFRSIHSDSIPHEVITHYQWTQLKPEDRSLYSGLFKGAPVGELKKMQEAFCEKLNYVLSTAPILDRLELEGDNYILGEFLEFKGKEDELAILRKIKRSKVSRLTFVRKTVFGFVLPMVELLYAPRDYRVGGPSQSSSSQSSSGKENLISSSTEVVFRPRNCKKSCKYKLSSVISISLSA